MSPTNDETSRDIIDLGHGHKGIFLQWAPDRELNPHTAHLPRVERFAMVITHVSPAGNECAGQITFAGDVQREISPRSVTWDVITWEPLTITPSVLCSCGDHGWIQNGVWVPA